MKDQDRPRFAVAMNAMSSLFGSVALPPTKLNLIFDSLEDLFIADVEAAAKQIMKNESRFPVPKTIREYAALSRPSLPTAHPERINIFSQAPATPFGKDCLAAIADLLDKKISKKQWLIKCQTILDKYNQSSVDPETGADWIAEQWSDLSSDMKAA